MTWAEFFKAAREEFVLAARVYFLPVTFLWVFVTGGWSAAKAHCLKVYRAEAPITKWLKDGE